MGRPLLSVPQFAQPMLPSYSRQDRSGVLLANHGAVTYGPTIQVAYDRALYLEWVSEVWLRAHALAPAFTPRILDEADMAEVYAKIQGSYATTGRPSDASPPG